MMRSFFENAEELFIGAFLQFPLYFVIGWWIVPLMGICALLWRHGGWDHGNKLFRRIGVPLVVCGATLLHTHNVAILLAVPFMCLLAPSYGESSWLFKKLKNDFLVRMITYFWYWTAFSIFYFISL